MAKKSIKLYEVRPDSMVYAISLVTSPAIESDFVYLSEEKPVQICLEKDEKHLVYGAVLIPNKPIYRRNQEEEFYIQFPSETIERLAHSYLQNDNIYSFTQQHSVIADGVSIVESWVKLSENDKSKDLGIDAPVGSWFIGAKIENDEIWDGIKSGTMKGFSIESFLNFDEIMMSKVEEDMTEQKLETIEVSEGFWMRIAEVIKAALKSPEVPELEAQVTSAQVIDEMKEEVIAEPEVVETPIEEVVEETVVEEPEVTEEVVEEPVVAEEPEVIAEEVTEEIVADASTEEEVKQDLQAVIDELNAKIDELNQELAKLQIENQKLSKQPSAKPINMKSEAAQGSNFERMLAIMNGSAFKK
jgi:hypothetical protein